jgi:hypothetical protein
MFFLLTEPYTTLLFFYGRNGTATGTILAAHGSWPQLGEQHLRVGAWIRSTYVFSFVECMYWEQLNSIDTQRLQMRNLLNNAKVCSRELDIA